MLSTTVSGRNLLETFVPIKSWLLSRSSGKRFTSPCQLVILSILLRGGLVILTVIRHGIFRFRRILFRKVQARLPFVKTRWPFSCHRLNTRIVGSRRVVAVFNNAGLTEWSNAALSLSILVLVFRRSYPRSLGSLYWSFSSSASVRP